MKCLQITVGFLNGYKNLRPRGESMRYTTHECIAVHVWELSVDTHHKIHPQCWGKGDIHLRFFYNRDCVYVTTKTLSCPNLKSCMNC